MSITSLSAHGAQVLGPAQPQAGRADPDGGADRAQELRKAGSPATVVQISEQAQQLLATSLASDPDHGTDGK